MDARVEQYKAWYRDYYQHEPPMGIVEKFCAMYGITQEKDEPEESDRVPESFWRDNPLDG